MIVEYDLENTGDRPIDYLPEKLMVDGKTYEADADAPQSSVPSGDGDQGDDSAPAPNPSLQRRLARQRTAIRATKQFFTAVRHRDASAVCTRLTEGTLKRFGGLASCKSGTFVRARAAVRARSPGNM